jgi:hypothetical protein
VEHEVKKPKEVKKRVRGGASHLCPRCEAPSHVIITRRQEGNVYRDRQCTHCNFVFRTREVKLGGAA